MILCDPSYVCSYSCQKVLVHYQKLISSERGHVDYAIYFSVENDLRMWMRTEFDAAYCDR